MMTNEQKKQNARSFVIKVATPPDSLSVALCRLDRGGVVWAVIFRKVLMEWKTHNIRPVTYLA